MRVTFYALVLAALVVIFLLVRVKPGDPATGTLVETEEPPGTTSDTVTAPSPDLGNLTEELGATRRQLAASQLARRRERRGYRRRLNYVIHAPLYRGHWLERAFLCIHAGEGAWSSNTGNGYHGGLQMDQSFQRTYGGWAVAAFGGAERWPSTVQIAVAIRAYMSRGFYPWPNTARSCGLIR